MYSQAREHTSREHQRRVFQRVSSASSLLLASRARRERLGLEHLGNNLLFLNQESAHDPLADAAVAAGAPVGALHCLLALAHAAALTGACRRDAVQFHLAVSALGDGAQLLLIVVHETAARGLDDGASVRLGVVAEAAAEREALNHVAA